jgi:hypothetical protein
MFTRPSHNYPNEKSNPPLYWGASADFLIFEKVINSFPLTPTPRILLAC